MCPHPFHPPQVIQPNGICWDPQPILITPLLSCPKKLSNSSCLPHKNNLFFESCKKKLKLKCCEGRGFCIGVRRL